MSPQADAFDPALVHAPAAAMLVVRLDAARQGELAAQATLSRWRQFVHVAGTRVAAGLGGRLLRSPGDGLLFEFDHARHAVQAAAELHHLIDQDNRAHASAEHLGLRVGLHGAEGRTDAGDVDLDAAALADRIASLAAPGETVVSESVRDRLTDGLDCALEDLGVLQADPGAEPLRAYRVGPVGAPARGHWSGDSAQGLLPTLAVIPFVQRLGNPADQAIGELLADMLNVHLGCSGQLRVINRLSTTLFRDRDSDPAHLRSKLGAAYALSGYYSRDGPRLHVQWELTDLRQAAPAAANRVTLAVSDLLDPASEALRAVARELQSAILRVELQRVDRQPMPTLESFTLLLGGVMLLHRSTPRDFARSFGLLSQLIEQHPRAVEPRIWLAKWYALRAVQGLPSDRLADARLALDSTARALDQEPDNSFALAMEGFVHCHLSFDFATADARVRAALRLNPSETFAHLFRSVIQGQQGDWNGGLASLSMACSTSPLDPARYLFDTIGSYLYLGAERHEDAQALARRSLRANSQHAHSWRVLTIAQAEAGDTEGARQSLRRVLALQPELTAQSYLGLRPDDPVRQRFAKALRQAGLPER